MTFGLYQTYSSDNSKKDLTAKQKDKLLLWLQEANRQEKQSLRDEIFYFISEHARQHDNFSYDIETAILPYNIKSNIDGDNTVTCDLDDLPALCRRRLFNFLKAKMKITE